MTDEWQEKENQYRDAMLEAAHEWKDRTDYEWNEKRQAYVKKTQAPEMKTKDYCLLAGLIVIIIILALLPPI